MMILRTMYYLVVVRRNDLKSRSYEIISLTFLYLQKTGHETKWVHMHV